MSFTIKELFKTNEGRSIKEYTFHNTKFQFSCLNIGASITEFTELSTGNNVVLAYEDKTLYLENPNYFGCVVGRNAGRIQNGELIIHDRTYELTKNFLGKHQLHSGNQGFQTKIFDAIIEGNKISFMTTSGDGEEGFPGEVTLRITYELKEDELHLSYQAKTDQATLINITNHSGFNLNLDKGEDVLHHHLQLNASHYFVLDEEMIPIRTESVEGTPLDFRGGKFIGKDINVPHPQIEIGNGIDHPFLIDKKEENEKVVTLKNEQLTLEVFTDQEVIVLYSGNFLEGKYSIGDGKKDEFRHMMCLETQGVPNNQHIKGYEDRNLYGKDDVYTQKTVWKLSVNQ